MVFRSGSAMCYSCLAAEMLKDLMIVVIGHQEAGGLMMFAAAAGCLGYLRHVVDEPVLEAKEINDGVCCCLC